MSCVGFDPTIPASERAKTVHALDCSATVTGKAYDYTIIIQISKISVLTIKITRQHTFLFVQGIMDMMQ
jgi:hypothetical protein